MYEVLRYVHVTTVVLSVSLFVVRGLWILGDSPRLRRRWLKIVPHLNDTLLLASAIALAVLTHQYPFVSAWLTAKVVALCLYIGLGMTALRFAKTKAMRCAAWTAALLVFSYIVWVALTRNPLPFAA